MYTKRAFISAWPALGAAIVACTLFAGAAFADPPAAPAADTRVANVSLAGLDLSTPEGARAAHDRIKIVVKRLCFQMEDPSEIDHLEAYNICVLKTLADTVRRINAPTLAALEK